ncbi:MAG TPA: hypothetical protein VFO41_09620 [Alphaproteobacteria bacterium]|nr:hypothetical protein [Alphaproteobacteria bacterium]
MSDVAADLDRTRHISVRVPELLAHQVDLIRARQRLRHYSDAVIYVLDRGLDAIANERRKPERMEAMVARTDDLTITIVAILNLVHDLDPAAVAQTRALVLEQLGVPERGQDKAQGPRFPGFGSRGGSR